MTKLIISDFEEKEYDLFSFGIEGYLIIEENSVYIQTQYYNYFLVLGEDKIISFVTAEEGEKEKLDLDETQYGIIYEILQNLNLI